MSGRRWVPQHHRDITLARLENFTTPERWHSDVNIRPCLYHARGGKVTLEVWDAPGLERPKFETVVNQKFKPCKVGDSFGPSWSTHWFKVTLQVPDEWKDTPAEGSNLLLLVWDSGSEAMVWTEDGQPQQGLTDGRNEYRLDVTVTPGAQYTLYIEMACNGVGGCSDTLLPPPTDRRYTLRVVELAVPHPAAQQLLNDFMLVADMAKSLPEDSAAGARALYLANQMVNTFRPDTPSTWEAASSIAAQALGVDCSTTLHKVTAVGHCHIDTAWLWPFEETHRKVARSWASQLQLLDQYPHFTFTASSAQQYTWLKADYPGLWSRLLTAIRGGRFLPVGGAWLECDTNLPSGESLVRQMLYGQAFFLENFGYRSDVFWLPDTFGYSAQLPQLLQGAGMPYFLTQKLSWNNINPFPHNTFLWEALDGSTVITHFPPSNTYGSHMSVSDVLMSVTNNKDKDRSPASLLLYGWGDGGGGPTQPMCEVLNRIADPAGGCVEGLPCVQQGSPSQFFKEVELTAHDLLTWKGELYFELHRGTYTSHAANKANNRRCEGLLREVEMLGALATTLGATDYSYPKCDLDSLWQSTLLFQFHDVLPGSAIKLVYDHTDKEYPRMLGQLSQLRSAATSAVLSVIPQPTGTPPGPETHPNMLPHSMQGHKLAQTSSGIKDQVTHTPPGPISPAAHQGRPEAEAEWVVLSPVTSLSRHDVHGARLPPVDAYDERQEPHRSSVPDRGQEPPQDNAAVKVQLQATEHGAAGAGGSLTSASPSRVTSDEAPATNEALNSAAVPAGAGSTAGSGGATGALGGAGSGAVTGGTTGTTDGSGGACAIGSAHGPVWYFNSLGVARNEVVEVPQQLVPTSLHVAQWSSAGSNPGSALVPLHMAPLSFTDAVGPEANFQAHSLNCGAKEGVSARMVQRANGDMVYQLMNLYVVAQFNGQGRLVSLLDRQCGRELVPQRPQQPQQQKQQQQQERKQQQQQGQRKQAEQSKQQSKQGDEDMPLGNRFKLYEDQPIFWDAWDIEIYHLEKGWDAGTPSQLCIIEQGPVRASLRYSCQLSDCAQLVQTISLCCNSPRLEFACEVDWHENRKVLKVEFPWDLASDGATYEVQFGAVVRPTHQNTSWDWARFEVCGHRWADLSEPDYGIALLNDSKYGHATHGSTQRLSLLRSPKAPDDTTDMGKHVFRYGLWPHAHGWQAGGVVAAGLAFNSPPVMCNPPSPTGHMKGLMMSTWIKQHADKPVLQVCPLSHCASHNPTPPLVIDTLKLAEPRPETAPPGTAMPAGGATSWVVRLYEPHGCRGTARLLLGGGLNITRAAVANLLEDVTQVLPLVPGPQGHCTEVHLPYTPFKVLTLLLWVTHVSPHIGSL